MSDDLELPPIPPPPPLPVAQEPDAVFSESRVDEPVRTCPNCGAPVHGPYCYACGQSERGMIRHLSEVLSEFSDIVFDVDSRIFRSLWDLYLRPGYLTVEYLAGRRARYVTPFRMFFFLSIFAFFSMQLALPEAKLNSLGATHLVETAMTPAEVNKAVEDEIHALSQPSLIEESPLSEHAEIEKDVTEVRKRGVQRLQTLKTQIDAAITAAEMPPLATPPATNSEMPAQEPESATTSQPNGSPASPNDVDGEGPKTLIGVFDEAVNLDENPAHIGWLSDAMNAKLNRTLKHMKSNVTNWNKDAGRLLAGFISILPQTLFVVMPLFAVLLKFFYLFKRRLYMEHLLVALHSHAFIFLSFLIILGLGLLSDLAGSRVWLTQPLGWLSALAWIWLFVYLLLMQKRVYRQGWLMTILKYGVIGFSYSIVLSIAFVFAGLISLALT